MTNEEETLLDRITYKGRPMDECDPLERAFIIELAYMLKPLQRSILGHKDGIIELTEKGEVNINFFPAPLDEKIRVVLASRDQ